jgi:hypothetical protein
MVVSKLHATLRNRHTHIHAMFHARRVRFVVSVSVRQARAPRPEYAVAQQSVSHALDIALHLPSGDSSNYITQTREHRDAR